MKEEILAAVMFLIRFIEKSESFPRDQIENFKHHLTTLLTQRFEKHWFPEVPTRGQGYRCIRVNGVSPIDVNLERAASKCGLRYRDLRLPAELTVWVDPTEVCYRLGESEGSYCTLATFPLVLTADLSSSSLHSSCSSSISSSSSSSSSASSDGASSDCGDSSASSRSPSPPVILNQVAAAPVMTTPRRLVQQRSTLTNSSVSCRQQQQQGQQGLSPMARYGNGGGQQAPPPAMNGGGYHQQQQRIKPLHRELSYNNNNNNMSLHSQQQPHNNRAPWRCDGPPYHPNATVTPPMFPHHRNMVYGTSRIYKNVLRV